MTSPLVSSPTVKRCARCHKKIKKGREHMVEGRVYGSECVQKILDQLNSKGVSG